MGALEWTSESQAPLYKILFQGNQTPWHPDPVCATMSNLHVLHGCSNTSATQLGAFLRTMSSGFLILNLSLGPPKYVFSDGAYPMQRE